MDTKPERTKRICIFGAGSIGCYVGGRMAAAGFPVTLIGRERLRLELDALRPAPDRSSWRRSARQTQRPSFCHRRQCSRDADLVMVTVKSSDTAAAGRALAGVLKPGTVVISFQNGMGNAARSRMQQQTVLIGMVQFNVTNRGGGHFHHGSKGGLEVSNTRPLNRSLRLSPRRVCR